MLKTLLAAFFVVYSCSAIAAESKTASITVERDKPVVASFLGFGAEWDPKFWTMGTFKTAVDPKEVTVTEADWQVVIKRIKWMRLPIVRMMFWYRWCTTGDGVFDWESAHMQSAYRHLDVCEKEGIEVFLSDAGAGWWEPVKPGITTPADPRYAQTVAAYLDHLVNRKNYTCIKYLGLVNEPNYQTNFPAWSLAMTNIPKELAAKKLDGKFILLGSDESGDRTWHTKTVDQFASVLGGYEFHRYARLPEIRSGGVFTYCQDRWAYALEKDPKAGSKPKIIGEAGIITSNNPNENLLHLDFSYGLHFCDMAIQAANAGTWAVCAWMLEDGSHATMTWGMWHDKAHGLGLKPWFYPWALMCRTFPRGCTILRSNASDLRMLAAEIPGKTVGWTFAFVNHGGETTKMVTAAKGSTVQLDRYVFSSTAARADADGFPVAVDQLMGDLTAGITIALPAQSVVVVTTVK
jgi:hypothetical protein